MGIKYNQLDKIELFPLKKIPVDGGDVMHCLKSCDLGFNGFGEAYFSCIEPNSVKAWKKHLKMTMNLIVPIGEVKFVFYCSENKKFRVEKIGEENYSRIMVPPGIWFGFMGINLKESLVLNIASCLHDPEEVQRLDIKKISYNWVK